MHAIAEPAKELRFTRAAQAKSFWLAAAVLAAAAVTVFASGCYRADNPRLPHPAWALAPLLAAVFLAHMAVRLTRHAYLILSPLGIEIFPFFRPAAGMQLIAWQEIDSFEIDPACTRLTLHHNREKTSGLHISLRPIPPERRELLGRALAGRFAETAER